jgi:ATP-dependent DNA helicase RecQ
VGLGPAQTLAQISTQAEVNKRRTQVILHLLLEAGLVCREKSGYALTANKPTDEVLEQLLQTYVDRAQRDKDRLAGMMHYAETPNCRTQILRAYFSDPEGDPCLRCDNCAAQYPDRVSPEFLSHLGIAPRAPRSEPAPEPAITTVQTAFGEIHTTAPETLPVVEPALPFHQGDTVRHKRFGQGKVLDIHNQIALVDFHKSGKKRLRTDFLEAA